MAKRIQKKITKRKRKALTKRNKIKHQYHFIPLLVILTLCVVLGVLLQRGYNITQFHIMGLFALGNLYRPLLIIRIILLILTAASLFPSINPLVNLNFLR